MVAYFKRQTWICIVCGALLGGFSALFLLKDYLAAQGTVMKVTIIGMLLLVGVVLGRFVASRLANRKLAALTALLYSQSNPDAFIEKFSKVLASTPKDNIAYFDGCVKMSFAYEARGDFENAVMLFSGADPSALKMHSLHATTMIANQLMRVYLLAEDAVNAEVQLNRLKELEEDANTRAKMLASQIHACVELGSRWLAFINGEETDLAYIEEEAGLARNNIYRAEMELLSANILISQNKKKEAKEHLQTVCDLVPDLWAGKEAEKLIKSV